MQDISNCAFLDCTDDSVAGGVEDLSNILLTDNDDEEGAAGASASETASETASDCSTSHVSETDEANYDVSSPESQWNGSDASCDDQRRVTIQHRDFLKHPRTRAPF